MCVHKLFDFYLCLLYSIQPDCHTAKNYPQRIPKLDHRPLKQQLSWTPLRFFFFFLNKTLLSGFLLQQYLYRILRNDLGTIVINPSIPYCFTTCFSDFNANGSFGCLRHISVWKRLCRIETVSLFKRVYGALHMTSTISPRPRGYWCTATAGTWLNQYMHGAGLLMR